MMQSVICPSTTAELLLFYATNLSVDHFHWCCFHVEVTYYYMQCTL